VIDRIHDALPGMILDSHSFRGDTTIVVEKERLPELADFLFEEGFQQLMDVTAVDWPTREPRFDVVYHFLNLITQGRLRIKLRVGENESVPSLVSRFRIADWSEREIFDLFGIPFEGHPDLRRLLMWEDFQGFPLRKDFPLDGGDTYCQSDLGTSFAGQAKSLDP
jgi:NADH-quinone oxidoreductase subunit C